MNNNVFMLQYGINSLSGIIETVKGKESALNIYLTCNVHYTNSIYKCYHHCIISMVFEAFLFSCFYFSISNFGFSKINNYLDK